MLYIPGQKEGTPSLIEKIKKTTSEIANENGISSIKKKKNQGEISH